MTEQATKKQDVLGRFQQLMATVNRCHALGATAAAALMFAIGWVSTLDPSDVSHVEVEGTIVNLDDAKALINDANQWRQQYTVAYTNSQELDGQVDEITTWLPKDVDSQAVEQSLRTIAENSELEILAIGMGDHHIGKRLGVVSATCTLQGTYKSLCGFLHALSQMSHPVVCSEVRLNRLNLDQGGSAATLAPRCTATLSLRIPFAAKGTAAGKLLSVEPKDAS